VQTRTPGGGGIQQLPGFVIVEQNVPGAAPTVSRTGISDMRMSVRAGLPEGMNRHWQINKLCRHPGAAALGYV
jgi:hypothetical protein